MKTSILLATAGLLLAAVEPGFAATHPHPAADAYASHAMAHERTAPHSSNGAFGWHWNGGRFPSAQGTAAEPLGPGHNLPYPDRPYGDPDGW